MTPLEAALATAPAFSGIAAHFMLDAATYGRGAELGFNGMDFYGAGRGGVLGAVDADVVSAALVFFNPATVRTVWDDSAAVLPRHEAAAAFIACGHDWAEGHLGDGVDWGRLAELLGPVVVGASPAGAPLFAGWRAMPEPDADRPKALALHRLNLMRELRMALHGAAVLAEGITPLEAMMVRSPFMAQIFGWVEPFPDAEPCREAWERAEDVTNRLMARPLAVLPEADLAELADLCQQADASIT